MRQMSLTKNSPENEIRQYFEAVCELSERNEEFPINLDEVWPLVYERRDKAFNELRKHFIENVDFKLLQKGKVVTFKTLTNGIKIDSYISVSCLEYFIARKVRPVFEVYRQVFHKVRKDISESQKNLPQNYLEALKQLVVQVEKNEKLQTEVEEKNEKIQFQSNEIQERKKKMMEQHHQLLYSQERNAQLTKKNEKLSERIKEDESKVNYFYQCADDADGSLLSFRQTAAILGVKERHFIKVLHYVGVLYYSNNGPMPYAGFLNKEYFRVVDGVAKNGKYYYQAKLTVEGRRYLNDNWERFEKIYNENMQKG